jgi:hypothetical protein
MSQLVNSLCVVCRERIESIIDGHICAACGVPLHEWCARPPETPDARKTCPICRGESAKVAARVKEVQEQHGPAPHEETKDLAKRPLSPLAFLLLFKFGVLGVVCFLLSLWWLITPQFRAEAGSLTFDDVMTGVAFMVVGMACIGLLIIFARQRR